MKISPPKDAETPVESPIPISPSLSVGSSSPFRSCWSLFVGLKELNPVILSRRTVPEDWQVKFATGNSHEDCLSWLNSYYVKPIGIEQADKIAWTELKRLLTNKYFPQTKVKKMEDEFYNLVVKGNYLKTYARRFQELAVLYVTKYGNQARETYRNLHRGINPESIERKCYALKPSNLVKPLP
ncbi:reverse transcriptase domain-containing protein [Tanacetum coccineum]